MFESIFKTQLEKKAEIDNAFQKLKQLPEWEESRKAFEQIINQFLHDSPRNKGTNNAPKILMSKEEMNGHFERSLIVTQKDAEAYHSWINTLINNNKDIGSPYYLANTAHHRRDQFYKKNQQVPLTGDGDQTLNAKFEAHNIYQKYKINTSSGMPERITETPNQFPSWNSIQEIMQDNTKFQSVFGFTDSDQEKEVFDIVSNWDWDKVQADLYLTPTMALNQVFSPALFSVYFFGPSEGSPKNIFVIVSANGNGDPEIPFLGIVNDPSNPRQKVYHADSRYAFTYLSSKENPMNYWMDMKNDGQQGFILGIETFYPNHPKHAYIEVLTDFCAQVPPEAIDFYQKVPFLKTFLMLIKGTLMRDLIRAYYPDSSSVDLWIKVGAIQQNQKFKKLFADILDGIAGIFDLFVWEEKPTVLTWENWHKTIGVGGSMRQIFAPNNGTEQLNKPIQNREFLTGLNTLLEIVKDAMNNNEVSRIRAFGSKWSLNNAAYTNDCMVKTWGLNYTKIGLVSSMVTQAYQDKADKLCFVQTGVMIHFLNNALFAQGLALKTTGASDGQRLVGAIAAGTHGSAMHVGAMQDYVKGIHLVIPDGDNNSKHVFLQRNSDQAVNTNFANFLDHTTIINDDELFNAAVVGFGCFGLIHGLLIETEPLFKLKQQTVRFNPNLDWYKDKLQTVMSNPTRKNIRALAKKHVSRNLFSWLNEEEGYPYFFSVNINPYHGLFPRTFFLEVMEKVPYNDDLHLSAPPPKALRAKVKHEAIHGGLAEAFSDNTTLSKSVLSDGIQIGLRAFNHNSRRPVIAATEAPYINFPNAIFSTKTATNPVTNSPCPATSTEIGVPISYVNEAVSCILEVLQTTLLGAALGIRYLPKSLATLAVNQYDDFTVTIELPGPQQGEGLLCSLFPDAKLAHNAIFEELNKRKIPHRFHWGQQYPLNTTWVTQSYGSEKVTAWQNARKRLLTTPKAQRLFANKLTDTIGLT